MIKCLRPIIGYRSKVKNKDTGKYPIVFSRHNAFTDMKYLLPCGKCELCQKRRALEMSKRAVHEAYLHKENCFVTLTYDDEHLPSDANAYREVQLFLMRLRKRGITFRYLCATEKGTSGTHRIHHHICFFGFNPLQRRWRYVVKNFGKNPSYYIPLLTSIWGNGHVLVSPFSEKTAYYTCSYCLKKAYGVKNEFEKIRSSRRPALGYNYYRTYWKDLFRNIRNGVKTLVPKYYIRKLKEEMPLQYFIFYELPLRRRGFRGNHRFVDPFDNASFLCYPELCKIEALKTERAVLKRKDL